MSLLSSSESLNFNSFLSSVDHSNLLEFEDISDKIHIRQGRDALTKATKDLMAMGGMAHSSHATKAQSRSAGSSVAGGGVSPALSHWPSFSPDLPGSSEDRHTQGHPDTRSHSRTFSGPYQTADSSSSTSQHQHVPQDSYASMVHPHAKSQMHIPSIRSLETAAASSLTLPPLADSLLIPVDAPQRGTLHSLISAPSVLRHSSSTASKRSLPDSEVPEGSSSNTLKRPRPYQPPSKSHPEPRRKSSVATSTSSSKTRASAPSKPALLSPSQKRANHIQSEQKRRANIRRGYEALCIAVPALRDAITMEEADGGGEAESSAGSVKGRKRRKKGEESAADGRAGPKSENVVLQKTIDYIRSLLTDRQALLSRLQFARSALTQEHPALMVTPVHVDENGVPMWEREWNGGTGIAEDGGDDDAGEEYAGDDDGGSEDEG